MVRVVLQHSPSRNHNDKLRLSQPAEARAAAPGPGCVCGAVIDQTNKCAIRDRDLFLERVNGSAVGDTRTPDEKVSHAEERALCPDCERRVRVRGQVVGRPGEGLSRHFMKAGGKSLSHPPIPARSATAP